MSVDVYESPMLNVRDAARYLAMPSATLGSWRRDRSVHSIEPERRGWPTLPFAAVVEAFVLRTLRVEANFPKSKIRDAVEGIRRQFGDAYGLVRPRIAWDAADIFIGIGAEYFRAKDGQQAIRNVLGGLTEVIAWEGQDPVRLRLTHLGNVILDPRFGWGSPVVEANKVPVEAIMGLWRGGDGIAAIAAEFRMTGAEVQEIIQGYDRARDAAA